MVFWFFVVFGGGCFCFFNKIAVGYSQVLVHIDASAL